MVEVQVAVHHRNDNSIVNTALGQGVVEVDDGGLVDLVDKGIPSADAGVDQDRTVRVRMSRPAWNFGDGPRLAGYAATSFRAA
jgi:hypothetical protein